MEAEVHALTTHVKQLSAKSICALRTLIGRQIHRVYAPSLDVAATHCSAPSFSFPTSDQLGDLWKHSHINVRASWFEAPVTGIDDWKIEASHDPQALGIPVDASGAMLGPCTVNFYEHGGSAVTAVEIYSFSDEANVGSDREVVTFDQVICFVRADETRLAIACQLNGPGIATDIHLSDGPADIAQFLEGCVLRLNLS